MSAVFARYLPDFSAEAAAASSEPEPEPLAVLLRAARRAAEPDMPVRAAAAAAPEPAEDRDALLREAEERGRRLGRAQAAAETAQALEAALAEAQAIADEQMRESRRDWAEREAGVLAEGVAAALRDLEARLTDRVAHLLGPVIGEALRAQAVASLREAIARLLADGANPAIRVSGPSDLLTALAASLGPLADGIAFTPAGTADVTVSAQDTVIETQLSAWSRLLSDALGSP
ncbi:hypothetical protein [Methylobacterium sp. ID0610]|uniref:hypothetical protein n=1 Tax=Methylobacterium carpenticola TaxID=3344827 RepID=UPI0036A9667B